MYDSEKIRLPPKIIESVKEDSIDMEKLKE